MRRIVSLHGVNEATNETTSAGECMRQPTVYRIKLRTESTTFDPVPKMGWRERAACGDAGPDDFFPKRGENLRTVLERAEKWCSGCPVRRECREYGKTQQDGIWGGLVRRDNKTVRPEPLQGCGTIAAYQRHLRESEVPCGACRKARRAYRKKAS